METPVDKIRRFTSSAPVNVEGLIRAFGIDLVKNAELDAEISGEIANLGDGKYRISVNKSDHYYRQRFTMAHELGHFLLHKDLIGSGVDDSRAYRSIRNGNFFNTNISTEHEAQANRFAANLLMPEQLVRDEFKKCNGDANALAKSLQVSPQALGYVLKSFGLAP